MEDEKQFPIQSDSTGPSSIPWWLAEIAYECYKDRYGGQQSLERIAERSGFGRKELVMLIRKGDD